MLLAIDVGNSQTVIGVFVGETAQRHWRLTTKSEETADEKIVRMEELLSLAGLRSEELTGVCLASVVPSATTAFIEAFSNNEQVDLLVVDSSKSGNLVIQYDRPENVGADRIANAVGGLHAFGGPLIIVDFGTATTFDIVSEAGAYLGGAIAPGLKTAADALVGRAAKLSGVELTAPGGFIGRNTEESLRAGIILGAAGMTDALIAGIKREMNANAKVIATGGLVDLVSPYCRLIDHVVPLLTLMGLKRIWELEKG